MQNTNRRRRGTLVHTTTSHTNINTHTHIHVHKKEGMEESQTDGSENEAAAQRIGAPSSLFPAAFHYLKRQPTHTTHTHTQIQRTSPFPKAVCLHSRHTAQKERKIEILRQCHSLASGLGYDKHVCMVTLSRLGGPEASVSWKQFPSTCAGRKGFPIHSILSRTKGDKDLIKASIDTLSSVACLHLVHLKFFFFFVYVSSGSPYLLHPSLSLCFPTVIDSSLQSLTAAHQHLLRSGETERVACAWKSVCCVMQAY